MSGTDSIQEDMGSRTNQNKEAQSRQSEDEHKKRRSKQKQRRSIRHDASTTQIIGEYVCLWSIPIMLLACLVPSIFSSTAFTPRSIPQSIPGILDTSQAPSSTPVLQSPFVALCSNAVQRMTEMKFAALDTLQSEITKRKSHVWQEQILKEVRGRIKMHRNYDQASSLLLYCKHDASICNRLIDVIHSALEFDFQFKGCSATIQAQGAADDDTAGQVQKAILSIVQDCPYGVIGFKDLHLASMEELKPVHRAVSELGRMTWNGKQYPTNDALYIFTMAGSLEIDSFENTTSFTHAVRGEVFDRLVKDMSDDEVIYSRALAFRRRLDSAVPVYF